jgi:20S proteasome alpha/beta subunit
MKTIFSTFLLWFMFEICSSERRLPFARFPSIISRDSEPRRFEAYADNGGTVVGLSGSDFCILAADTRLSEQHMIRSRNISRVFQVSLFLGCFLSSYTD